ncbi:MAG: hypothetical protein UY20_C0004G0002 [Candidatus Yanofskybacteria bacterium GW2011_GWA1_48_10]|uniref:Uncharacterized protein n=1 Tax=Candidatus Yanofskybacteria bacterium GW2011_GWA1_48_10 TaxID=1619022 RepID=A0A0G1X5Y1_9BACT|nr:MAG: hypothetical protein UW69_C0031G0003 [Microgenomates group bacterium GW2011_GWA2_44_7]KKU89820.1 MAG: hypothetical protein UY20_C0004G0002 [Candidatus Yanofskybacteria bacterium GW2011_GWA1_48_10]
MPKGFWFYRNQGCALVAAIMLLCACGTAALVVLGPSVKTVKDQKDGVDLIARVDPDLGRLAEAAIKISKGDPADATAALAGAERDLASARESNSRAKLLSQEAEAQRLKNLSTVGGAVNVALDAVGGALAALVAAVGVAGVVLAILAFLAGAWFARPKKH